jgi:hypothetical protein
MANAAMPFGINGQVVGAVEPNVRFFGGKQGYVGVLVGWSDRIRMVRSVMLISNNARQHERARTAAMSVHSCASGAHQDCGGRL